MNRIQKHLKLHGRVQGVGFRHFTYRNAQNLGVNGWVKNMTDGTVEVYMEGARERIEEMENALNKGPISARVQRIEELPVQPAQKDIDGFTVRR